MISFLPNFSQYLATSTPSQCIFASCESTSAAYISCPRKRGGGGGGGGGGEREIEGRRKVRRRRRGRRRWWRKVGGGGRGGGRQGLGFGAAA